MVTKETNGTFRDCFFLKLNSVPVNDDTLSLNTAFYVVKKELIKKRLDYIETL
jgi:hypothetical protein